MAVRRTTVTLPGADVSLDVEDASKHGSYTVYHVRVRRGGASWLVLRRFSDFQALNKALRKRMSVSGMRGVTLPPMPGKSLFKMSASVVTDRVAGFRSYLQVGARNGAASARPVAHSVGDVGCLAAFC